MATTIDARGLACPQPVILTKKALDENDEVVVLVNDKVARENVRRLATTMGAAVEEEQHGTEIRLRITKDGSCSLAQDIIAGQGPVVTVITSDTMGSPDTVLGGVLMKSFLNTLTQTTPAPDVMILYNAGVKLAVQGSEVLDDLQALTSAGVRILVCGTCLNFFELKDLLAIGQVSNMYDIAQTMLTAGRIVQI